MRCARGTFLGVLLLCVSVPVPVYAVTIEEIIFRLTNWASCLDFQTQGPCINPVTREPGLRVAYRLPHLLLDTVKIPGDSTIDALRVPFSGLLVPGGGALGNTGEWHLQYNESHVVEWPMREAMALHALPIPEKLWCVDQMQYGGLLPHFLSEFDALMWRANALPEEVFPWSIGVWAPLAPRTGHCIHYSPPVASGVVGFRGTHIAAFPGLHLILAPLWFPLIPFDDKMQLAVPTVRECIDIGQHPLSWDHGVGAHDGKYLWVYWHRVSCCITSVNTQ